MPPDALLLPGSKSRQKHLLLATCRLDKLNHFVKGFFRLFIRNLAGSHHLVTTTAEFKHQGADINCCRPVENTVAHRKRDEPAIFTIENADREVRFRIERIDEKTI